MRLTPGCLGYHLSSVDQLSVLDIPSETVSTFGPSNFSLSCLSTLKFTISKISPLPLRHSPHEGSIYEKN